jgi:hypothetical protein
MKRVSLGIAWKAGFSIVGTARLHEHLQTEPNEIAATVENLMWHEELDNLLLVDIGQAHMWKTG